MRLFPARLLLPSKQSAMPSLTLHVNAVFAAFGVHLARLPFRRERVRAAPGEKPGAV